MKRAIVIVMDGCGAGEAPDAPAFGDVDHPNTLRHVWEACRGLHLPFFREIGILASAGISAQDPTGEIGSHFGRLQELSEGKDSVTGHWEMMGIVTSVAFPTYPTGFPQELIDLFEARIGRKIIGNKAASGTEIIEELGPQHEETGCPIVYTSADSVFQIACDESIVPVADLYQMCQVAREVCIVPNNVERVIARPFVGSQGSYIRTGNRRDFALDPPCNLIDEFNGHFGLVYGLGVVPELFNHRGFMKIPRSRNNQEHEEALLQALESDRPFIFANFEDFDMLYGHRNNPIGFGKALERMDQFLSKLYATLGADDLLILTADHGNDPTTASTDHSREFVPFAALNRTYLIENLGDMKGFKTVGDAVMNWLL